MAFSRRRVWGALLVALWGIGVSGGVAGASAEEPLRVAAASSLAEALREIHAAFNRETGVVVELSLGASNTLVRQLKAGAPSDVFISADAARMDELVAAGLVTAGTRVEWLTNSLVIVVPVDSALALKAPADLAGPAVARWVTGDPRGVPVGVYAKQYLESQGLWERLKPKLVAAESARAALAAVASGNMDAGIVYKTDAAASKKVKIAVEVPAEQGPSITYPAAVLKQAAQPERARRYLEFLRSPAATAVFEKRGFRLLATAKNDQGEKPR